MKEGLAELMVSYDIVDVTEAATLAVTGGGTIDWKDVSFAFEANPNAVFNHFNLTIPSGQRVGLVGASGAGKSTFVSLLLRQHELTGGAIEIDGQNIAVVTQDSLRSHIAVVPQEPILFHRSIRENIAYGSPDATTEDIETAAKHAYAHEFIMTLPEGYETLVGERGVKLSGGQKQRVAIARAMLKKAPILILDEATSALDSESEVEIQKALHVLMEGKTVVAVAHRLSTLREMDRILVLENGTIIEDGTHDSLKDAGGTYATLWNHQAGGFLTV
jgi:ABC-type multidrug transport system fused ATPase/permease subunit